MVTQEQLDALAKEITDATTAIQTEVSSLETEIANGKSANELDLSKLKAAVGGLTSIETPPAGSGAATPAAATAAQAGGNAPLNADGTAVEHTEDPGVAAARTALVDAETAAKAKQANAEDAARQTV